MSGISPARNFRSGMEERASFRNRTVPLADQTEARLGRVVCHSRWVIKPRNSLRNVRIAERFEFAYGMCRLAAVMMQPPDPLPSRSPPQKTKTENVRTRSRIRFVRSRSDVMIFGGGSSGVGGGGGGDEVDGLANEGPAPRR
jgi:hypothetical protein